MRIIEYAFDDPGRPGAAEKHRLLTTLLDAQEHPAKRLIVVYHETWEEELARRSRPGATGTAAVSHQSASDQMQNEQLAQETQETQQNTAANEEIRPVY